MRACLATGALDSGAGDELVNADPVLELRGLQRTVVFAPGRQSAVDAVLGYPSASLFTVEG